MLKKKIGQEPTLRQIPPIQFNLSKHGVLCMVSAECSCFLAIRLHCFSASFTSHTPRYQFTAPCTANNRIEPTGSARLCFVPAARSYCSSFMVSDLLPSLCHCHSIIISLERRFVDDLRLIVACPIRTLDENMARHAQASGKKLSKLL